MTSNYQKLLTINALKTTH